MPHDNGYFNASHLPDPTAYEAMKNSERDSERYRKFIGCLFRIAELSGFFINEAVITDKRTGERHIV